MNVLVTAGNTAAPVDRVRHLTNVFTGRTGAAVALHAHSRGHAVTLLTSHPEVVKDLCTGAPPAANWAVVPYRTFDHLHEAMAARVPGGAHDALVHCAAVSDYLCAGVYAPAPDTRFHPEDRRWEGPEALGPRLVDRAAAKVKSDEPELWLRLVRAPKLVDRVRTDWAFRGLLVKFKLEAGVSDADLLAVAEQSRRHSGADLMVANTLEGAGACAFLGPLAGSYQRVTRAELPNRLLEALEQLHRERAHA